MHLPILCASIPRTDVSAINRPTCSPRILPAGACGTSWHERWVRDRWGRADFTGACRNHDRCYETCGRSKGDCDHAFHNDLRAACRRGYRSWLQRPLLRTCLELANTYHSAVHRMGGDAYRDAQNQSGCQ